MYKPEKAAHLQGRSSAGASLGSEDRLDSGPAPPPEALATRGFRVGTRTVTGSPAQAYVVGTVRRAAAQGAQGQGPLPAKLTHQRKEQVSARASPHSDVCCERNSMLTVLVHFMRQLGWATVPRYWVILDVAVRLFLDETNM